MKLPGAERALEATYRSEARRTTRVDAAGELVLLEDQDRSLWDRARIDEAKWFVELALAAGPAGPYALQAAIAGVHADAAGVAGTDWTRIVALYDGLLRAAPSPVIALNRAVALAMRDGPDAGLAAIEVVLGQGGLDDYPLAHAARADLQRRLGLTEAAQASYQRALALTRQPAERRFLEARLAGLAAGGQ